jgi:hypothetical protein
MKWFDLLLLRLAVWVLKDRNVARCRFISRRDNNDLYYMSERIEAIINRIKTDYET